MDPPKSEHALKIERMEALLQAWRGLDLDGKRHHLDEQSLEMTARCVRVSSTVGCTDLPWLEAPALHPTPYPPPLPPVLRVPKSQSFAG